MELNISEETTFTEQNLSPVSIKQALYQMLQMTKMNFEKLLR